MSDSILVTIAQTQEKLRQLTQIDVQTSWRYSSEDLSVEAIDPSDWQLAQPNEKGYLCWSSGRQVQWLAQQFIVPQDLQGYPLEGMVLRLVLTWWAEQAQIFVNGKLVQEGDLFDSSVRLLLTPSAKPGEIITVALRLVSPGHDIGALMRSRLIYEKTHNPIEPGFVADELTVLHQYLETFEPEKLNALATATQQIDWNVVCDAEKFDRCLSNLRQTLQPLAASIKERCFHLLGHAHLDMAWLWTTSETWEVAQRTFESVLHLQQDFPELTFCHTSPALYAWIEKHRPDLFKAIQEAVKAKSWEVLGGMWVEPEVTITSGESIVRQLLYGQRYIREKFGEITQVAWLPDSFGFSWQLPQIFKQSGIEYFVTGKLHWNDTTKFPHGVFWWQSPDGTQLLTLMSPPNVMGVMDTNPIVMANYAIDWERQTGLKDTFWLPGVGDRGGGPSRDMLEVQRRWRQSPFFPQIKFATADEYLFVVSGQSLVENRQPTTNDKPVTFPIWNDELYLEFHRGCYTTHADQKSYNRRCEGLLYQAELWASLATIILGQAYPKTELEDAWKKVLFNQFHDILPGTSIPEVFVEANETWQEVERVGQKVLNKSLSAIASQITLPPPPHPNARPIIIFNSLNWQRSEVVVCSIPSGNWEIYDLAGQKLLSQLSADGQLLFLAKNIPSVGYRLFWLCPCQQPTTNHQPLTSHQNFILENEKLRVIINPETGDLNSIFDRIDRREILKGAGNQLQAFEDKGQYWDAWNIDPNYAQHPLPPARLKSIRYLECGPLQWRVRIVKQLNNSEFCQDYVLHANSPILKIATMVNWQETHVLVKVAFPLNVESDFATYEIPCGAIKRPTNPQTPAEKAKWEVYALRWADLGDREYGVSLLNDCKYGYDSQPTQLRLTLLRSPQWPDPGADKGTHQFTYAIYPHQGSWQAAKTVRYGYELNVPLTVLSGELDNREKTHSLPATSQLLDLDSENLILMAFKQSEDDPNAWILRCYECHGGTVKHSLKGDLQWASETPVDLLEQPLKEISEINPWKIVSFKLRQPET
ncbi:glycoside hydrolase family 38 C-terminal domain-containing protein [Hydrococcus rivularis]|uniref:glycoside hydrolase family 38 N-terminal domain-containing protein n=1 Tax=Hydrococcus rivularis TaxID=1616834 RepID=UPI0009F91A96